LFKQRPNDNKVGVNVETWLRRSEQGGSIDHCVAEKEKVPILYDNDALHSTHTRPTPDGPQDRNDGDIFCRHVGHSVLNFEKLIERENTFVSHLSSHMKCLFCFVMLFFANGTFPPTVHFVV
jgi:hypothetical protein